jgi:hypothetical protein
VWSVFDESTYDNKDAQDFEIFYDPTTARKIICTDLDDAYYEYTYIVTDPTVWDAKFYMALSFKLAASMGHALGVPEKALTILQQYTMLLQEAKRIGSSEQKKKPPRKSSYQDARG